MNWIKSILVLGILLPGLASAQGNTYGGGTGGGGATTSTGGVVAPTALADDFAVGCATPGCSAPLNNTTDNANEAGFFFDETSGNLWLNKKGAGIIARPSDSVGSGITLSEPGLNGGNSFTLKVDDSTNFNSSILCTIGSNGRLNVACPLFQKPDNYYSATMYENTPNTPASGNGAGLTSYTDVGIDNIEYLTTSSEVWDPNNIVTGINVARVTMASPMGQNTHRFNKLNPLIIKGITGGPTVLNWVPGGSTSSLYTHSVLSTSNECPASTTVVGGVTCNTAQFLLKTVTVPACAIPTNICASTFLDLSGEPAYVASANDFVRFGRVGGYIAQSITGSGSTRLTPLITPDESLNSSPYSDTVGGSPILLAGTETEDTHYRITTTTTRYATNSPACSYAVFANDGGGSINFGGGGKTFSTEVLGGTSTETFTVPASTPATTTNFLTYWSTLGGCGWLNLPSEVNPYGDIKLDIEIWPGVCQ